MNWSVVQGQLSGTYTVGSIGSEDYNSITNAGGFFQDVNAIGLSGNVLLQVTSDLLFETGTVPLNAFAGGYSITIVPKNAGVKTINHSSCFNDLLNIEGADNLIIDGSFAGSGHYLRLTSSCPDQSVIRCNNDCKNITIKNTWIQSDNSQTSILNGGAIHIDENQTDGCDNLEISNNKICDFSGAIDLFDAIQINAPNTAGAVLSGLIIQNNEIYNANGKGIFIIDNAGEINQVQVLRNHLYATGVITGPGALWAYAPIQIESGSGHTIYGNYIGGQAKNCLGGKMNVQLISGSRTVNFIRMKQELPNGVMNNIDSNVIRNISIINSGADLLSVSVFRLENGNNQVGVNEGNIIGDQTVDVSVPANASIYIENTDNTNSSSFNVLRTSSTGITVAENNYVGGLLIHNSNGSELEANIFYSNVSSASYRKNNIGGVSNNIMKTCKGDFKIFYSNAGNSDMRIDSNVVMGIKTDGDFSNDFCGIQVSSGLGKPSISNNQFSNISIGKWSYTSTSRFFGIRVENPSARIDSNSIQDVTLHSLNTQQFFGIYFSYNATTAKIRENRVSNVILSHPSAATAAIGIYSEASGSVVEIRKNFLDQFKIQSSSTSSYFRMIYVNDALQNIISNNVVLLDNNGLTTNMLLYGIYENNNEIGGVSTIWHNTVDIRGATTGTKRSSCYYRIGSSRCNIQSNVFNNRRKRTVSTGDNYALYFSNSSGIVIADYNLLYCEDDVNELVFFSGSKSFASWQFSGYGANSVTTLTPQNLVDFTNGKQTTYLGNDRANPFLGILEDIEWDIRPQGTGFDMGAYEESSSNPPLPVQLISFGLECQDRGLHVKWATLTELENQFFTLYSSQDAANWTNVATINGSGTTNTAHYYSYYLKDFPVNSYVKLTQTDFNGTVSDLGVESVWCDHAPEDCIRVFPNPSSGHDVRVELVGCESDDPISISVFDGIGQLIWYKELSSSDDSAIYQISPNNSLPQGNYLLKVNFLRSSQCIKFTVL